MSSAPLCFGGEGQCPPHTLPGTALDPLALNAGDRPSRIEPRLVAATPSSIARGIAPGNPERPALHGAAPAVAVGVR